MLYQTCIWIQLVYGWSEGLRPAFHVHSFGSERTLSSQARIVECEASLTPVYQSPVGGIDVGVQLCKDGGSFVRNRVFEGTVTIS